jgi:hypothetical protein
LPIALPGGPSLNLVEPEFEVFDQIVDIFESHAQAQQAGRDAAF